jgi:predicted nucleic acid-binding protein
MSFVLDASVSLAWHFEDQNSAAARHLANRASDEGVVVPAYWEFETANGLLRGERMGRTDAASIAQFIDHLNSLSVQIDTLEVNAAFEVALPFARETGLRLFDAGYLIVAVRNQLPLATFDKKLAGAAREAGVTVLGD